MIHQGRIGWNMLCNNHDLWQRDSQRGSSKLFWHLAEEWMSFVDKTQQQQNSDTDGNIEANALDLIMNGHRPTITPSSKCNYCWVCKIEENIISKLEIEKMKDLKSKQLSAMEIEEQMSWKYDLGPSSRTQQHLCTCSSSKCTLICHVVRTESNQRMIFTLEQFQGMSCFEVGHVLLKEGYSIARLAIKQNNV